jgi:hypothetical protein
MSIPVAWPPILDFFGTPLVIEPASGQLSSGAGLLPVRQFDERLRLTQAFAAALDDPRDPDLTEHTLASLPVASAARPVGGRSPLHLAYLAHQGGGGSRGEDAADRNTTVIELAAPRLVSLGERAPACPPFRFPFPILLADPLDSPLRYLPQAGVRGRCASGAGPGRMGVPNGARGPWPAALRRGA